MSGLRMAKASKAEMDGMIDFFNGLEKMQELSFRVDKNGFDRLGRWVFHRFKKIAAGWRRVAFGYVILFDNCVDPDKDHLEFKPEIYKALESRRLHKISEWSEEFGDCLFFYFPSFEEPPEVLCTTPESSDWDDRFSHFIRLDFNDIIEQAMERCQT